MSGTNTTRVKWRAAQRPLTELNRQISERYKACVAAGTHHPGDELTAPRPLRAANAGTDYLTLRTCATCGVPITKLDKSWNNSFG